MLVYVKFDDVICDTGVMGTERPDGFNLQIETSYIAPTLSSVQNAIVASSSGIVLTQRNPGMFNINVMIFMFRFCFVRACEAACKNNLSVGCTLHKVYTYMGNRRAVPLHY